MNNGHDHRDVAGNLQEVGLPVHKLVRVSTTPQGTSSSYQAHTKARGKAAPIDPFTSDNLEITVEEWLPSLQRAAEWNDWTENEILIQLAGHLWGQALQEWNLLEANKQGIGNEQLKCCRIASNIEILLLLPESFDICTKARRKQ